MITNQDSINALELHFRILDRMNDKGFISDKEFCIVTEEIIKRIGKYEREEPYDVDKRL